MKTVLIAFFAATTFVAAFAAPSEPKRERTPEERERSRQIRIQRYRAKVEKEGGIVDGLIPGKDIRIVNAQTSVTEAEIADVVKAMRNTLRVQIETVPGAKGRECPFAVAECAFDGGNTAGVVALVESDKFPRLVIRPEDHTAIVNVSELKKDAPDAEKLALRVRKEIWRGFGYAMGAANSGFQPCVMRDVKSLADLDEKPIAILSPEPLMRIDPALRQLGLAQLRHATYKRACEEGWAPAPTNDWQKAVWEKVKAEQSETPTKGIKIKFDKSKKAGVR